MVNVTGKHRGYRFLPHHAKFSKKMRIRLPYDKTKLPPGKTEDEITAYYFNDQINRWMPVEKEQVDKNTNETVNLTDHFTDFINAVIVVPEHPQVQNFNPNMIKDLKAALPGAGITMINPPTANNKGDAILNYQIEIPPGRNGMQPNVTISYNSSGGDGLLGYGWDLPVKSVSCDTKFGVPRYYACSETESYLLEGEQLVPTARGVSFTARTAADKRFFARVEGKFQRIIRKSKDIVNPGADKYYWQVTDRDGVQHIYGEIGGDTGSNTTIGPPGGTFVWALRTSTDRNGNYIKYYYRADELNWNNNILLDRITYAGHVGDSEGYYEIKFNYSDRNDVSGGMGAGVRTDGKGGYIRKIAKKLASIDVNANGARVRKYEFDYTPGPFHRDMLTNIKQYGADGTTLISNTSHQMTYYMDMSGDGNVFNNSKDTTWNTQLNDSNTECINLFGINLPNGPSAISSNITKSWGENYNIEGGLEPWFTVHVNWGYTNSYGHAVYNLMDLDGDGIPDEIFTPTGSSEGAGSDYYWRPNLWSRINTGQNFGGDSTVSHVDGLTSISTDTSKANMIGGGASVVGMGGSVNQTTVKSTQNRYMIDVNGDGLPDLVDDGTVKFAHRSYDASGNTKITYSCSSNDTEVEVGLAKVPDLDSIEQLAADKYMNDLQASPLVSVIKRWEAPYTGTIKIEGDVMLRNGGDEMAAYTTKDGVWASIQQNGAELWRLQISPAGGPSDFSPHTPAGVGSINVTAGDRIYFRLQSYYDGMFDKVAWAPVITYTSRDPSLKDVNNIDQSDFHYTNDFTLAGQREISTTLKYRGLVRIAGDLVKSGVTSDDIKLRIILRHPLPTPSPTPTGTPDFIHYIETDINQADTHTDQVLSWNQTGSLPMGSATPEPGGSNYFRQIFVNAGDELVLRADVDSNIDLSKISWHPIIYYWFIMPTAGEPVPPAIDTSITYTARDEFTKYIEKIYSPYDIKFYPVNLKQELTTPYTVIKPLLDPKPLPTIDANENLVLRLRGQMTKTQATSQDITVMLVINSQTNGDGTLIEGTGTTVNVCVIPKDVVGTCFALPDNYVVLTPNSTVTRSLLPLNNIRIKIVTGTEADMNSISWDPKLRYSSMKYSTWSPKWIYQDLGPVAESPMPYEADLTTDNETWIRNMSIKPGIIETGGNTVPTHFTLTVKRQVGLIAKGKFDVAAGPVVEQVVPLSDIKVGEKIYFEAFTDTSTSYSHVNINEPIYVFAVFPNFYFGDSVNRIVNRFSDEDVGLFPSGYRGWAAAGLKETPEIMKPDFVPATGGYTLQDVLKIQMDSVYMPYFMVPSCLTVPSGYPIDESKLSYNYLNTVTYTVTDVDQVAFLPSPYDPDNPGNTLNMWKATDDIYCTSTDMSSSRIGDKYIKKLSVSDILGSLTGVSCNTQGINRVSASTQYGLSVTAFGIGAFGSLGTSQCISDYYDMNGDGFPDFVSDYFGVQYTRPEGGLGDTKSGNLQSSNSLLLNVGAGSPTDPVITKPDGQGENGTDGQKPAGSESKGMTMSGGFSFSGSVSYGLSIIITKYMDMNGDGLPDRVNIPAYNSIQDFLNSVNHDQVMVSLNEGYGNYGPAEPWAIDNAAITNNQTTAGGAGIGAGGEVGLGVVSIGATGGISGGLAWSQSLETLMDVNGDGLPDYIAKDGRVRFNTGSGFTGFYGSGLDDSYGKSFSINAGYNYGFSVHIRIPIWPIGVIMIGGGYNKSNNQSLSKQNSMIMDVDGDGYPDRLVSNSSGGLDVEFSKIGKTCLLQSVKRPMGSEIKLDYTRSVNTFDQPRSKWNLTSVTVTAIPADTTVQQAITASLPDQNMFYAYYGGKYDKNDREFLGYSCVTETVRLDATHTRLTSREYCNNDRFGSSLRYVYKGLLLREMTFDGSALSTPHYVKTYTYDPSPPPIYINPDEYKYHTISFYPDAYSYFPALLSTVEDFYEGSSHISRTESYGCDSCGNVTSYDLTDSEGVDVHAGITYKYISDPDYFTGTDVIADNKRLDLPTDIVVTSGGTTYRHRSALYDANDNVYSVTQDSASGHSITTLMGYDTTYTGNLKWLQLPQNGNSLTQSFTYTYDGVSGLNQYITGVTDNLGYSSTNDYNYAYGKVSKTTDENNNLEYFMYDQFGRLSGVAGPNELTGGITAHYEYQPDGLAGENIPYAVTKNRDMARGDNDPIKIIIYTDGLGKIIQTKKDAAVSPDGSLPQEVMVVTGKMVYDSGGRLLEQHYPMTETKVTDIPAGSEGSGGDSGNTSYFTGVNGYNTTYAYDVFDRELTWTYPDGKQSTCNYAVDSGKLKAVVKDADLNFKETLKDSEQRIIQVNERDDTVLHKTISTVYTYDPVGQIITVTDALNNKTAITYDLMGRRTSINNPDTGLVTTEYDDASNIKSKQTDNLLHISGSTKINYSYNAVNQLITVNYPTVGTIPAETVSYTYGGVSAPYNCAGRVATVTYPQGTKELRYDALGNVIYEYHAINLAGGGSVDKTTQYTWDNLSRVLNMTYPDGEILAYGYDSAGLLTQAAGTKNSTTTEYIKHIFYDSFGKRIDMLTGSGDIPGTRLSGVGTRYQYNDNNQRLHELITTQRDGSGVSGYAIQDLIYTYDNVGNITEIDNMMPRNMEIPTSDPEIVRKSFAYDGFYRLITSTASQQKPYNSDPSLNISRWCSVGTTYDDIQNISTKMQIVASSGVNDPMLSYNFSYSYNASPGGPHAPNHITDILNGSLQRNLNYDYDGNLTSYAYGAFSRQMTWDAENRLRKSVDNGTAGTENYWYDESGQRVLKQDPGPGVQTAYVNQYSDDVINGGTTETKHIFAGNQRIVSVITLGGTPNLYYYQTDHLGSTGYLTDQGGNLAEHIEYTPWGESWFNNPATPVLNHKFTGKEQDNTGLYYFGARYYDPQISIWMSTDPALDKYFKSKKGEGGIYNPKNLDLYSYASQNPIILIDSDGNYVIYIDCGHGTNNDPGAVSAKGQNESDLVIPIGKALEKAFVASGDVVIFKDWRGVKTSMPRTIRAEDANKKEADVFISVHIDEGKGGKGFVAIYDKNGKEGRKLAEKIAKAINDAGEDTGFLSGKAKADEDYADKAELTVLRKTHMAAVLFEVGNVDSPNVKKRDKNETLIDTIITAVHDFLDNKEKAKNKGSK
jgi:RHS repeat-associated protein